MKTTASQLKAKLGRFMKAVKAGKEVIVTDRDQPVARLVPYAEPAVPALVISQARDPTAPPLGDVAIAPIRYDGVSTTQLLAEDRARR